MPATPKQAITAARNQSQNGPAFGTGLCLQRVRMCFEVDALYPDASAGWRGAKIKHPTTDPMAAPRGAVLWWTGGSSGHGHVAIATGEGKCWSTDILRPGYFDFVDIDLIRQKWGLRFEGWSEDINGVRVFGVEPAKGLRVDGVDLSHHNDQDIDWDAATEAGVRFVYHKVTEGASFVDGAYVQRRKESTVPLGGYHFARPDKTRTDPEQEAAHFLEHLDVAEGDFAAVLDLEVDGGLSISQLDAWALAWCKKVKPAVGRVGYYGPFKLPKTQKYVDFVIRARYHNDNEPPLLDDWDVRQFSNGEYGVPNSVAGIGHVDLNHLRTGVRLKDLLVPAVATPPVEVEGPRIRVRTWNVGDGSDEEKQADLFELEGSCDVMLLSEFGDRKNVPPRAGYARYAGEGLPGQASTPIDYRIGFFDRVIGQGSEPLTPRVDIGAEGPGPRKAKPKWANWVLVEHAGRHIRFVSFHGVPAPHLNEKREKVGDDQVDELVRLIKEEWAGQGLVILGGDFNRKLDEDPDLERLVEAGMAWVQTGPTHADNIYDGVLYKAKGDRVRVVRSRTNKTTSDHRSPLVELEIKPKPASL